MMLGLQSTRDGEGEEYKEEEEDGVKEAEEGKELGTFYDIKVSWLSMR